MTIIHALILGILQGLTEFLPISSSGHLVVAEHLFNFSMPVSELQGFDVLLHGGSLIALLICYASQWKRIILSPFSRDKEARYLLMILIIASIPAALAGIFLNGWIANSFRSPNTVALAFALTGIVLILADRLSPGTEKLSLRPLRALLVGVGQACALVPGISRSGLTISAARAMGLSKKSAVDFAFLLAAPIIAGAVLVTLKDLTNGSVIFPSTNIVITGVLASFGSSVLAVMFLRRFVVSHQLGWFALYLFPLSGILLLQTL